MKKITYLLSRGVIALLAAHLVGAAQASSHMDAPLITRDPAANTTDVYAFVQNRNGMKSLVTALGVYPHEEPGVGPNKYNFDDNVLYQIRVATGERRCSGQSHVELRVQIRHDVQKPEHDSAVVPWDHQRRRRRQSEPGADLHRHQGGPSPA